MTEPSDEASEAPTAGGPSDGAPVHLFTQMQLGAMATHELFRSYVMVGFSEPQAVFLVAAVLRESLRKAP